MQKINPVASGTLSIIIAMSLNTFGILFICLSSIYVLEGWSRVGIMGLGIGFCLVSAALLLRYILLGSKSVSEEVR